MNLRTAILSAVIILVGLILSCSKDTNPAVPPAPTGDVISMVERDPVMRIGLVSFSPQKHIYISITRGNFNCYVTDSLQTFATGMNGNVFKFSGADEEIEFTDQYDQTRGLSQEIVRIEPADGAANGHIQVGTSKNDLRAYRGIIRLVLEGKNILVINELPLEEYLLGVVPAEMNFEWPDEALKAQAVVSRTYALFNMNRFDGRGYDIADDARSQLYGGYDVETDATTQAVVDTTYEVLSFEGNLACACFHKESTGETASVLDVILYSQEVPYLKGVTETAGSRDYSSGGEYQSWSSSATFEQLRTAFNHDGETYVGDFLSSLTILAKSDSGRVQIINIDGEKNRTIPAMTFSQVLNRTISPDFLPSNQFTMTYNGTGYTFDGSGAGHGIGLSQWGAYQRALDSQDYNLILAHYFTGTVIIEIPLDGIPVIHNTRIDLIQ